MTLYYNGPKSKCPLGHVPSDYLHGLPKETKEIHPVEQTDEDLLRTQRMNDDILGIRPIRTKDRLKEDLLFTMDADETAQLRSKILEGHF